jgi:hypothetical protein
MPASFAYVVVWAAQSAVAANEAFNITNGDVFEWRRVCPALADALGSSPVLTRAQSVAEYLSDKSEVWDTIVAKYGLRHASLQAFVGHGDQHADFAFAYSAAQEPHAFVSTVKLAKLASPGSTARIGDT